MVTAQLNEPHKTIGTSHVKFFFCVFPGIENTELKGINSSKQVKTGIRYKLQ